MKNKATNKLSNKTSKTFADKKTDVKTKSGDYSIRASVIEIQNPSNVYALYSDEFSYLKPHNIHYYFECARKGLNVWKGLLFEEIKRRDLHLGGVCQTRKLSVIRKNFSIGYKNDSELNETTQKEMLRIIEESLGNIDIYQFITDIIEAQLQGVTTFEAIWEPTSKGATLKQLEIIPNHLLVFDDINNQYKYIRADKLDLTSLRNKGSEIFKDRIDMTGYVHEEINPLKLLEVHSFDGNAQNGFMNGCIDSLIWSYIFKHFGLKDWSIYIEKFASPAVVGTRPALMNDGDRRAFETAIQNFGNVSRIVVPEGCKIDFPGDTQKSSSSDAFDRYINYWDRAIAIRVLGQELTTAAGDKGTKALGAVHNLVREDLVIADMMLVKSSINKLIRRIIDFNFVNVTEYPFWKWDEEANIEYKKIRSDIIKNLHDSGHDIEPEDIEKEFDVHVTKKNLQNKDSKNKDSKTFVDDFIERVIDSVDKK